MWACGMHLGSKCQSHATRYISSWLCTKKASNSVSHGNAHNGVAECSHLASTWWLWWLISSVLGPFLGTTGCTQIDLNATNLISR